MLSSRLDCATSCVVSDVRLGRTSRGYVVSDVPLRRTSSWAYVSGVRRLGPTSRARVVSDVRRLGRTLSRTYVVSGVRRLGHTSWVYVSDERLRRTSWAASSLKQASKQRMRASERAGEDNAIYKVVLALAVLSKLGKKGLP